MNTLRKLLDEGAQFDPHYVPSMNTDHLPMGLVAIAQLGGSDTALQDFQSRYKARLRPVVLGPDVTSVAEGRGRFEAFSGLRALLQAEVQNRGAADVIRTYLPELLPSVAAGAFHPIIRLGFAIKAGHDAEVASALAYWLIQGFNPNLEAAITADGLKTRLEQLEPADIPAGRFGAGLEQLVVQNAYPTPLLTSLQDCASASLAVYLGTRNFFALHFVTATQAARVCLPFSSEQEIVSALTAAIQAGYLVVGSPDFSEPLPAPQQLDEEHSIKYVFACGEEYRHYGDRRYRDEMLSFVEQGLVPNWVTIPD